METNAVEALQIVRGALSRTRNAMLVLAVVMLAFAFVCLGALDEHSTTGSKLMAYSMMGFFGLLGALFIWVALVKNHPDRSPLIVALRDRPELVVWIYAQEVKVNVNGIDAPVRDSNVIAQLADGSTVALTVKKDRAEQVLAAIAQLATDATVGFTDERLAQFKKEPRSLARSMQT